MFTHTGGYGSFLLALAGKDFDLHLCRAPVVRVRDLEELIMWKRWGWQADACCSLIYPGGSYATLREVLQRGGVCAIAFDVPGRRETTFLGQRMGLASGIASLALEVGVPVLPALAIPGTGGEIGRLEAAIEPASFAHVNQLHAHLADVTSRAIAEHPHLAYPPHAAVHDAHARTPLVRRLERHLAKAKGEGGASSGRGGFEARACGGSPSVGSGLDVVAARSSRAASRRHPRTCPLGRRGLERSRGPREVKPVTTPQARTRPVTALRRSATFPTWDP